MSVRAGMAAFKGKRRKPLEAIRAFCVACQGGAYEAVAGCALSSCPLRPYRGSAVPADGETAVPAIRAYCVEHCLPGQPDEVTTCQAFSQAGPNPPCPLWPFRLGADPYSRQTTTEGSRERQLTLLPCAPSPLSTDESSS